VKLPKGCDRHEMLGSYSNEHAQIKESVETDQVTVKPPSKIQIAYWTRQAVHSISA